MDPVEEGYKPGGGFDEDYRDPLVDLNLSDSTELWLFQWPHNELPDFHGKEIPLHLVDDGCMGSFEGSSGKSYDVVSCTAEEADATVFLSSASGTKIIEKISRRVSIVHYPDPIELERQELEKKSKRLYQTQQSSLTNSSHHSATPTQSSKPRNSSSSREHSALAHSGRTKSHFTQVREHSSDRKKRRTHEPSGSSDRSTIFTKSSKHSH